MVKKEVKVNRQNIISPRDDPHNELTLYELIYYNLLFLIPLAMSFFISSFLSKKLEYYLDASPNVIANILMFPLTMIVFFFIVPYIRNRENVKGVRYALVGFFIVGISMTLPAMIVKKDFGMLFTNLLYVASYILITFIYCPEVLGIEGDIKTWFRQNKQLIILLVWSSIVIFYILGFAQIYYMLETDNTHPNAYAYNLETPFTHMTAIYYSTVTFATVGYGDITPLSTAARLVFIMQALISMVINIMFVAILLLYVSNSQLWAQAKEEKKIEKEEEKIEKEEEKIEKEEEMIEKKQKQILAEEKRIESRIKNRKK